MLGYAVLIAVLIVVICWIDPLKSKLINFLIEHIDYEHFESKYLFKFKGKRADMLYIRRKFSPIWIRANVVGAYIATQTNIMMRRVDDVRALIHLVSEFKIYIKEQKKVIADKNKTRSFEEWIVTENV